MLDIWYPALAAVALFCFDRGPKLRTWLVMIASSLAGWFLPPVSVAGYMVVDILAAIIVMSRPLGLAQKVIGGLFGAMIGFHVGFLVSGRHGWELYYFIQYAVGWAQLLFLLSWGLWDAGLARLVDRSRWRARAAVDRRASDR